MTEKELLYYEDAIGHETNTIAIYNYFLDYIKDNELISTLKKQVKKHETIKERLLSTMEREANE